jgi:hypothetical protein
MLQAGKCQLWEPKVVAMLIKPLSRRSVLQLSLVSVSAAILSQPLLAATGNATPVITVWKTPTCGCCKAWVSHLQKNGFEVVTNNVNDTTAIRKKLGLPDQYGSCHTAKLGNYVIEGHVPAEDIRKLLKDKPVARGLSVPGMPLGSPGMEGTGPFAGERHAYNVLLVLNDGSSRVFKTYSAIPPVKT